MDNGQLVAYVGLGYLVCVIIVLLVAVAILHITAAPKREEEDEIPLGYETRPPMRELTAEEWRQVMADAPMTTFNPAAESVRWPL